MAVKLYKDQEHFYDNLFAQTERRLDTHRPDPIRHQEILDAINHPDHRHWFGALRDEKKSRLASLACAMETVAKEMGIRNLEALDPYVERPSTDARPYKSLLELAQAYDEEERVLHPYTANLVTIELFAKANQAEDKKIEVRNGRYHVKVGSYGGGLRLLRRFIKEGTFTHVDHISLHTKMAGNYKPRLAILHGLFSLGFVGKVTITVGDNRKIMKPSLMQAEERQFLELFKITREAYTECKHPYGSRRDLTVMKKEIELIHAHHKVDKDQKILKLYAQSLAPEQQMILLLNASEDTQALRSYLLPVMVSEKILFSQNKDGTFEYDDTPFLKRRWSMQNAIPKALAMAGKKILPFLSDEIQEKEGRGTFGQHQHAQTLSTWLFNVLNKLNAADIQKRVEALRDLERLPQHENDAEAFEKATQALKLEILTLLLPHVAPKDQDAFLRHYLYKQEHKAHQKLKPAKKLEGEKARKTQDVLEALQKLMRQEAPLTDREQKILQVRFKHKPTYRAIQQLQKSPTAQERAQLVPQLYAEESLLTRALKTEDLPLRLMPKKAKPSAEQLKAQAKFEALSGKPIEDHHFKANEALLKELRFNAGKLVLEARKLDSKASRRQRELAAIRRATKQLQKDAYQRTQRTPTMV